MATGSAKIVGLALILIGSSWIVVNPALSFALRSVSYAARLASIGLLAVALAVRLRDSTRRFASGGPSVTGPSISLVSVAVATLLLEAAFMFVPRSHGVGYTLAARIWKLYYWRPLNSLGYRDVEPNLDPRQTRLFVLGDSFTAGQGIRRVRDRFSDRLAARLPGDYAVFNLGMSGADPASEYERLATYPVEPDMLILQYYVNDIHSAAQGAGRLGRELAPISTSAHRPRCSFATPFC